MTSVTRWISWAGLVCGTILAGCQHVPPRDAPATQSVAINRPAPDFSLPDYQGGKAITLSSFKGKVVLVNFYETTCAHCQHEITDFVRVHRDLKLKGFEIIGISLDQDGLMDGARQVSNVAHRFRIPYPLAIGNEEVARRYGGIENVPTSFLVDRQGRVVRIFPGVVKDTTLNEAARSLL